ncbi:MAG: hypothetical protein ACON4O_07480 [Lentimonas sp.]
MNLSSFIREKKDLSDLEETQMNRCYDWLFDHQRRCKEDVENLEKRIPRMVNGYSICESKVRLESSRRFEKLYSDFMKYIDEEIKSKKDLDHILEFVKYFGGKEIYEKDMDFR